MPEKQAILLHFQAILLHLDSDQGESLLAANRLDAEGRGDCVDVATNRLHVPHSGGNIFVPKDLLYRLDVVALADHQSGTSVAHAVRCDGRASPLHHVAVEISVREILVTHRLASLSREDQIEPAQTSLRCELLKGLEHVWVHRHV